MEKEKDKQPEQGIILTAHEEKAADKEEVTGTLLTDQQAATPRKKKGIAAWKIIVPLIIVAALAAGAYFLFFNKSPELKAAEADQEEYEEKVADCRKALRQADSFAELEEAKEKFDDIEDMEIEHSRVLPEVYSQLDNLNEYYDKMTEKLRKECKQQADELIDQNDYRGAYDLYIQAANALPDDEEFHRLCKRTAKAMGYIYVTEMKFANCERDGTDIEAAGSRLQIGRAHV